MEEDESMQQELVRSCELVEVDPRQLVAGFNNVGAERRLLVMELPSVGSVLPLWRSREEMLATLRQMCPSCDPGSHTVARIRGKDEIVAFAKQNDLTIIIDLKVVDDELSYGRLVWN
jgi:hypothetical protein